MKSHLHHQPAVILNYCIGMTNFAARGHWTSAVVRSRKSMGTPRRVTIVETGNGHIIGNDIHNLTRVKMVCSWVNGEILMCKLPSTAKYFIHMIVIESAVVERVTIVVTSLEEIDGNGSHNW